MAEGTCAVPECTKRSYTRGWCGAHFYRWRKHGDPLHVRTCGNEGCSEPVRANGLCKSHNYKEWRKTSDRADYMRQWAEQNRAARQEYHRAWREANPEYSDQWREARPGYGAENRRRRRARLRALPSVPFTPEMLAAKLVYWGARCWLCSDPWAEWDHVKPLAKGGSHMLANLRPVCVPCNRSKQAGWYGPMRPALARQHPLILR